MTDTNSGIFIRAADPTKIGADTWHAGHVAQVRTITRLINRKIIKERKQHSWDHAVGMKTLCFVHGALVE